MTLLLIAWPTAFALSVVIQLWEIRRRRKNPARGRLHPLCSRCDYLLIGLHGCTCPECGSDLCKPRAVAFDTRRQRWMNRAIWPLVFLALTPAWYGLANKAISPKLRVFQMSMISSGSQEYEGVVVTASDSDIQIYSSGDMQESIDRIRWQVDLSKLRVVFLDLFHANTRYEYAIVLDDTIPQQAGSRGMILVDAASFSYGILEGWFRDQGIDVELPQVREELTAITGVVQHLLEGREPEQTIASPYFQAVKHRYVSVALPQGPGLNRVREPLLLVTFAVTLVIFWIPFIAWLLLFRWWVHSDRQRRLDTAGLPLDLDQMCLFA